MKVLSKRYRQFVGEQEEKARLEAQQQMLDGMTEEERREYLAEEKKRQNEAVRLLGHVVGIAAALGHYGE